MKRMKKYVAGALVALAVGVQAADEADGWLLSCQTYTFRDRTLAEAADACVKLGIKYVEIYPGQAIGGGLEGKVNHNLPADQRDQLLAMLKAKGVTPRQYGVVNAGNEAEWRKIFEFGKAMGLTSIASEPPPELLPMLDKLAKEFGISVAIHNHPKPSRYWSPETVLEAVKGCSERIGVCADVGHWVRSGLDPVECLRKLKGRIVSVHFKELNVKAPKAHDVPWGTGNQLADSLLAEFKAQGYKGLFSIEYEKLSPTMEEEIAKCVAFFKAWGKK